MKDALPGHPYSHANIRDKTILDHSKGSMSLVDKMNSEKNCSVHVYFALDGDTFNPDEITSFLWIEPTDTIHAGTKNDHGLTRKRSSWQYGTGMITAKYVDIYDVASSLVDELIPVTSLICEAQEMRDVRARLQVVIYFSWDSSHPMPALGLDQRTVRFLADVWASVDVDMYEGVYD